MPTPQQAFVPEDGMFPLNGLNTRDIGAVIPATYSPEVKNIDFTRGVAKKRSGYGDLGTQAKKVDDTVRGEPVMLIHEYTDSDGTNYLLKITTKHQLRYDTATDKWVDITRRRAGGAHTIDSINTGTKTFTLVSGAGDKTSEFVSNSHFEIAAHSTAANNGIYTVASSSFGGGKTSIVCHQVIANGTTSGTAEGFHEWTGNETNPIDFTVGSDLTAGRIFIICNGVDDLLFWNGTNEFQTLSITGLTNFVTCKTVEFFGDQLFLGHAIYSPAEDNQSQKFEFSKKGDLDAFSGGNSGSGSLIDDDGGIRRLLKLGDKLAVYNEKSIGTVTKVGGDDLYYYETIIPKVNILSSRSIVDSGPYHLFMTDENIYAFDGSRLIRPVADEITNLIDQEVYRDVRERAFAAYDTVEGKLFFVFPSSATDSKAFIQEFNPEDINIRTWSLYDWDDRITAIGSRTLTTDLTYSIAGGQGITYEKALGLTYNSSLLNKGTPSRVLGTSGGEVHHDLGMSNQDGTVAIEGYWLSKEFSVPTHYITRKGRWLTLEIEAKGTSVEVQHRTDERPDWVTAETLTLSSQFESYRVYFDTYGELCQIRLYDATSGWFEFRWIRLWVKLGGVR